MVANCSAQRCSFSEKSICSGVNIFFVDSLCFSSLLISGMGKSWYTFSFSATTINLKSWQHNKHFKVDLLLGTRIQNCKDSILNLFFYIKSVIMLRSAVGLTRFTVSACDGLYQLIKSIGSNWNTPLGSNRSCGHCMQVPDFSRTPGSDQVTWAKWANH